MRIKTKLMLGATALTALAVLLAAGSTAFLALRGGAKALEQPIEQRFAAIASGREQRLLSEVRATRELLLSLADGRMLQDAVYAFTRPYVSYRYEVPTVATEHLRAELADWYASRYDPLHRERSGGKAAPFQDWLAAMSHEALLLQRYYMRDNPNPADRLAALSDRADATIYGQQHRRYHDSLRSIVERFGFNDLMLIAAQSRAIMYSVAKGPAFATSLRNGPFADGALAALTEELLQPGGGERFAISRFAAFPGRFDQQVVFFGVPVAHAAHSPDRALGLLVVELPAERFTALMTDDGDWAAAGLGSTGEAYLVDADGRLLTELRPLLENPRAFLAELRQARGPILPTELPAGQGLGGRLQLDTPAVRAALAGEAGMGLTEDYLGRPMLTAWTPLQLGQHRLALITQQAPAEVYGPLAELRRNVLTSVAVAVLAVALLAALASFRFAELLGRPLRELAAAIGEAAARRDLSRRFGAARGDEIGIIGKALDELFETLEQLIGRIAAMAHAAAESAAGNAVISEQCRQSAHDQRAALHALGGKSEDVAAATGRIAGEMTAAASAAETAAQLAASGQERVGGVARLMEQLAEEIAGSGASVVALQKAASDIGNVLATIRGVAEQTNLLALNAAIEAARAGEQGRGFAVVAGEVRALAASTGEATGSIQAMIERLQANMDEVAGAIEQERRSADRCGAEADEAVQALAEIGAAVETIRATNARIAEATELQRTRSAAIQAQLTEVVTEADRTETAMDHLAATAGQQQSMAAELEQAAGRFRTGVAQRA